jgi:hypothetical protein
MMVYGEQDTVMSWDELDIVMEKNNGKFEVAGTPL